MKTRFLLPHRFKVLGWYLFFPFLILCLLQFLGGVEPDWLDARVPMLFGQEEGIEWVKNNLADEICSFLFLLSCMLLVFGSEKDEDEFIMRLRLESLLWAALVNGVVVLLAIVFTYEFAFFYIMILNLFLLFLLFIVRFHLILTRFRSRGE